MQYDPKEMEDGENGKYAPKPGRYRFKVDEATERLRKNGNAYKSGNEGLSVRLLVDGSGKYEDKCFENFTYTPKALWRLKEFLSSIGLDFDASPDALDCEGRIGVADFRTKPSMCGKYINLEVANYCEEGEDATGPAVDDRATYSYGAKSVEDDAPPF